MRSSELGEYLRACRARIDPADVGLPSLGVRRVAGLRREEVALLAGMSADYYTRLEQGRERTPSGQVVDAIARALRLSADAREHMLRLAGVIPATLRSAPAELVDPALLQLLDSLHDVAAYIANRVMDVLATNAVFTDLFSAFGPIDNVARMVFCNPTAKSLLSNWQTAAENCVHTLRLAAGYAPRTDLDALVREMSQASHEFDELWRMNKPSARAPLVNSVYHERLGLIPFMSIAFDAHDANGQQLVLLFPQAASPASQAWAVLGAHRDGPGSIPSDGWRAR